MTDANDIQQARGSEGLLRAFDDAHSVREMQNDEPDDAGDLEPVSDVVEIPLNGHGATSRSRSAGAASVDQPPRLTLVNPVDLVDIEPPPRKWAVPDWIPANTLTLLYGPATVGKSMVLQQLAVAIATRTPWLGLAVTGGRALALFGEDDGDELHRRAVSICRAQGIGLAQLGDVRWEGRAGLPNVIATAREDGIVTPTSLFAAINEAVAAYRPTVTILDNIGQMFAGNENSRSEVTQFGGLLIGLAKEHGTAVVLAGHPAKAEGSEYSGSTAWDAVCRSRLLLERPKPEADDVPAELRDVRILRRPSANYAQAFAEITLKWSDGAFVAAEDRPSDIVGRIETATRERVCETAFLERLDKLAAEGRGTSHHRTAPNYAPKIMATMLPGEKIKRVELERAMNALFASGAIIAGGVVGKRANRHIIVGITRTPQPTATP
jgi:RecA-family ATPase